MTRKRLAAAAWWLGASAVFAILMAYTTNTREQEAWSISAGLLAVPALFLGFAWALEATRRSSKR
jgi:hypothetical protein